ncbi:thiosulfate reductase cytochrome B subunit [Citrobacter werkmanii]|nr:thiosulfate reductase cytochrome B subunit [Citrobacter werkmanii]
MRGLLTRSFFFLLVGAMPLAGFSAPIPTEQLNQPCLACHADEDIEGISTDKVQNNLFVSPDKYHDSVHGEVPCIACHQSKPGSEGFSVTPHVLNAGGDKNCESCHGVVMRDTVHAVQQSVHSEKIAKGLFSCTSCHNAHTMTAGEINHPGKQRIADDNLMCTNCHSRAGVFTQLSGGKASTSQDMAHSVLPYATEHLKSLRCIDCHADIADTTLHRIQPASQTIGCEQCHGDSALLATRLKTFAPDEDALVGSLLGKGLFDDTSLREKLATVAPRVPMVRQIDGVLFTDTYMIGNNGSGQADRLIAWGLGGFVVLLLCHGFGRLIMSRRTADMPMEKSYLYTLPVRCWHWLNALCFAALIISGCALHWVSARFSLWVDVHNIAGVALCVIWLGFILVAIFGNGHHYRVRWQGFVGRFIRQTRYYLYGIFRGEYHPEHASSEAKFNILQQLGYICVMFLLLPMLIVTGLLMMFPALTPETLLALPGRQVVAWLHYGLAVVMVVFIIVHLYLCSTGDTPGALIKGMLDGFHRSRKKK